MKREFLINILLLVLINLLVKPIYLFGIDRTVQNTVGEANYGLYYALFNFAFIFQILNDLGLQQFNNRNIAQHRHLLSKYFPHFLMLKAGLGLLYLLCLFAGAAIFGYPLSTFPLLAFVGFNWLLSSLILFLRSNLSGLGFYRTDSLLSVLDRFLLILICGYLLWFYSGAAAFRIEWFVYTQTLTLFLTVVVAYSLVARHIQKWTFRWSWPLMKLLLKKSYPYALVIFLMLLYTRVDAFMIERLRVDGAQEAGLYATAYRLLDASNIFGLLFATLLLPMFASMLKTGEALVPLLSMSFRLIWAGAFSLTIACLMFRQPIMEWLYVSGSTYTGDLLAWLMLSFLSICGCYIYGTLLTASGNLRQMNQLFVLGVMLNIGLNLWLIPTRGALGAAMATCFTQAMVWIGQVLLVRRLLGVGVPVRIGWQILGFSISVVLTALLIKTQLSFHWIVKFLLCICTSLALAFLFKLINLIATLHMLGKGRELN
ncbi:MAG: oligosaccharide flippase family protein [Saprospiraceae bacterium]